MQQLEQQLAELESKHRRLIQSYSDLGGAHQRLRREVGLLKSELGFLRGGDVGSSEGVFEQFASGGFVDVAANGSF